MNRMGCGMTRVNIGERDTSSPHVGQSNLRRLAASKSEVGRSLGSLPLAPQPTALLKLCRVPLSLSTKFSMREGGCMARKPKNHGESWTKADDRQLKTLVRQNTPTRLIASKLGRTEGAVYQHASSIGASLRPTNQSPNNRRKK
jgi:hypothetical protein